jgi:hypothetical protein
LRPAPAAQFQIRADPRKAAKELNNNLLLFATIVLTCRLSTYILSLNSKLQ